MKIIPSILTYLIALGIITGMTYLHIYIFGLPTNTTFTELFFRLTAGVALFIAISNNYTD